MSTPLLYGLIIGCEAAFWLVLAIALCVRYLLCRQRLSRLLLLLLPALDVLLLVFTAADLRAGATATFAHGLAAAYVGFTIAFGPILIEWADQRFAHRFANGPAPVPYPDRGWAAVRYEMNLWVRCLVAWVIALVLLLGLIAFVGEAARTQDLLQWVQHAVGVSLVWFVFGPAWAFLFQRGEGKRAK